MNYQKLIDTNKILLLIASALIAYALFIPKINSINLDNNYSFEKPTNAVLLELSEPVIKSLNNSGNDGLALANLYKDLATLIEVDDSIIKNTEEIREANRLSGKMLQLDIKGKYPNLAESANNLVITYIGDDNAVLSTELREKSVDAFKALAWACSEGSK